MVSLNTGVASQSDSRALKWLPISTCNATTLKRLHIVTSIEDHSIEMASHSHMYAVPQKWKDDTLLQYVWKAIALKWLPILTCMLCHNSEKMTHCYNTYGRL